MNHATGYYSLIQYCPDPSRLEAANIGVLVFSPTHGFLKARTVGNNRRIIQFFGQEGHDWARINSFKKGIEERLEVEKPDIQTLEDLEAFSARRANRIQITAPRSMRVTDPEKDLAALFQELLGAEEPTPGRKSLKSFLQERFHRAGLERKVRTDIAVVVPAFRREVEIPFGYQNGRFNLIQPARFEAKETSQAITTACKYAVEGRSLFEHPDANLGELQLVVLGSFPMRRTQSRQVVRQIFEENQVKLFTTTDLDRLIEDIRVNGRDIIDAGNPR